MTTYRRTPDELEELAATLSRQITLSEFQASLRVGRDVYVAPLPKVVAK